MLAQERKQKLISELTSMFGQPAVEKWLVEYNKVFGARPIDLLNSRDFEPIEKMIVELEHGLPD